MFSSIQLFLIEIYSALILKGYSKLCSSGERELNTPMSILWIYIRMLQRLQPLTHWLVPLYVCMYMVMCPCRRQYGVCVSMARTCSLAAPVINVLRYGYSDYLWSCMHGSENMTEVTNLSSLACFRSGTSRLGPVNGEITMSAPHLCCVYTAVV